MSAASTATRFNDAINARDLHTLDELMTDDHAFVDTEANRFEGKPRCIEIWASFFSSFPDYRNHFDSLDDRGDHVVIAGRSECSTAVLAGPALWLARVHDGRVSEWCVFEDTTDNRAKLVIPL